MPLYYYVPVPELPAKIAHQSNSVRIVEYHVQEDQKVEPGTPLVTVENWWAKMQIDSTSPGYVSKLFFSPGTDVRVGDPFAIITCDGEDAPAGRPASALRILTITRQKPN
jgi:pyruvate/2-oxoglutarate dehydrogenase complex dihydrolipoamide acyltransferase (E2) component